MVTYGKASEVPPWTSGDHRSGNLGLTCYQLSSGARTASYTRRREKQLPEGDTYDWFRYDVIRVWELPVESFLHAGLPVLPLAPVSSIGPDGLREVLARVAERLRAEAP